MLLTVDFYLRASLEVSSLIKKMAGGKFEHRDDKLAILWGVYSREPTLNILNGVLALSNNNDTSNSSEKL